MTATAATHLVGAGTFPIGAGPGAVLERVVVNTPIAGTATLYDGTVAQNVVIGVPSTATAVSLQYGVPLRNGLTVVTSGATDLTVIVDGGPSVSLAPQ